MAWSQILDLLESELLRGREVGSLLVLFFFFLLLSLLFFFLTLGFLVFFVFLLFLIFFLFPLYFPVFSSCCLLCTSMAFYIACNDMIYYFYPSTTFGMLWVSSLDFPLVCQLSNHHHYTVLAVPCLILRQK